MILKVFDYINVTLVSNSQPYWSCSQGRHMFYINWSSSSIGWLSLRNIHFTNGNESFPFVCPLSFYRTGLWETRWVSY